MTLNLSRHPVVLIEEFARSLARTSRFELSYYKYRPQSLLDERRRVRIRAPELNALKIKELLEGLRPDEELAFHSSILVGPRKKVHLPLIDFFGHLNSGSLELIEKTIGSRLFESLAIYDSGRSFHGYILHPVSEREWVRFMGTILLMNLPDQHPVADSRWVGHRLRAGYASLRWSRNTEQYLMPPTRVLVEEIRAGR